MSRAGRRLLLLGGGHAQLSVLHRLAALRTDRPAGLASLANVEVVLVTPWQRQVYSGMLPGWLAGHYSTEQCVIALAPLAGRAGAQVRWAAATGLDADARQVRLDSGEVLAYDLLSVNVGPSQDLAGLGAQAVPALRPIEHWIGHTAHRLAHDLPRQVVVIGGGAAGFELALAWAWRLRQSGRGAAVTLVAGSSGLLANYPSGVVRRGRQALVRHGVRLLQARVTHADASGVTTEDGHHHAADEVVIATGAVAPAWLRGSGLALAPDGGIATGPTLQSASHPDVLAVGDVASRLVQPLPHSGVYAVRAGPVLADNLLALLAGQAPRAWAAPQRTLNLLSTGERSAIAAWGPLAWQGGWVWRWKDHIDRTFMQRMGA